MFSNNKHQYRWKMLKQQDAWINEKAQKENDSLQP